MEEALDHIAPRCPPVAPDRSVRAVRQHPANAALPDMPVATGRLPPAVAARSGFPYGEAALAWLGKALAARFLTVDQCRVPKCKPPCLRYLPLRAGAAG